MAMAVVVVVLVGGCWFLPFGNLNYVISIQTGHKIHRIREYDSNQKHYICVRISQQISARPHTIHGNYYLH